MHVQAFSLGDIRHRDAAVLQPQLDMIPVHACMHSILATPHVGQHSTIHMATKCSLTMCRSPAAQPERHVDQSLDSVHALPAGAMLLHLISMSNSHWKTDHAIPAGAKLFYLSGMKNGRYMKREVLNLARFISVMKFRPLSWRQTHPFLLADRFEVGVWCLLLESGS